MPDDLKNMETQTLIDMLAKHTEAYTKLMTDGSKKEEFEQSKQTIRLIQQEIRSRQDNSQISPFSDSDINSVTAE